MSVNTALFKQVCHQDSSCVNFWEVLGREALAWLEQTKTWWNPSMLANGGYGTESSQQTGKKTVWSGPFTDPATGKTVQVRDTYTFPNLTTYTDLYQANVGGTWKTEGNTTCTKA